MRQLSRVPVVSSTAIATETPPQLAPFPDGGHPPDAIVFDLDGTLTETELLKVSTSCISGDAGIASLA